MSKRIPTLLFIISLFFEILYFKTNNDKFSFLMVFSLVLGLFINKKNIINE